MMMLNNGKDYDSNNNNQDNDNNVKDDKLG